MKDEQILENLKVDLQISTNKMDPYLTNIIGLAKSAIEREGINLEETIEDGMLTEMYAAHLYRKRKEEEIAMPRMLRWNLNNRLLSQKAGE